MITLQTKTKKHSITQAQQLDKLARTIRSCYEATERLAKSAKERARDAIAEAILCGNSLNEAKAIVGHGAWLKWLAKHCKGVDCETARRYMRLSNSSHDMNLGNPASLRQAYIMAGIIEEPEPETQATIGTLSISIPETLPAPCSALPAVCHPEPPKGQDVATQSTECVLGHPESKSQSAMSPLLQEQSDTADFDHHIRLVLYYKAAPWFEARLASFGFTFRP